MNIKWQELGEDAPLPEKSTDAQDILGRNFRELNEAVTKGRRKGIAGVLSRITKKQEPMEKLQKRRDAYEKALAELKKPIKTREEFDRAADDMASWELLRNRVKSADLEQADLAYLLQSEMSVFFRPDLAKELETSSGKMFRRTRLADTLILQNEDPAITREAEEVWRKNEKALKSQLKELKKKNAPAAEVEEVKRALDNKISWIRQYVERAKAEKWAWQENNERAAFLRSGEAEKLDEDTRRAIAEQVKDNEKRKRRLTLEMDKQDSILVSNLLPYEAKLELTNIFLEAEAIRKKEVIGFLRKKHERIYAQFQQLRKEEKFSEDQAQKIEKLLTVEIGKKFLENPKLVTSTCDELKKLDESLDRLDEEMSQTDRSLGFTDEMKKDPEGFKKNLLLKVRNIRQAARLFTQERIDARLRELDEEERAEKEPSGSMNIYKKERDTLAFFRDYAVRGKESELGQMMAEIEKRIQTGEMDQEEWAETVHSLKQLEKMTGQFSEEKVSAMNSDSRKAARAIEELKDAKDPEEVKQILVKILGKEHVEFISETDFRSYRETDGKTRDLREYTPQGNMVFYECGGEWKIIVNADGIRGKDGQLKTDALKEELTHELRHLEFEGNKEMKQTWLKSFQQSGKWEEVKTSFFHAYPDKKPPVGETWRDEDILSEIYAMQEDFKNITPEEIERLKKAEKPMDQFRKAVIDSGVPASFMGLSPEAVRGYSEAKIRGSGHAHGPDEEAQVHEHKHEDHGKEGHGQSHEEGPSYDLYKTQINWNEKDIQKLMKMKYITYIPGSIGLLQMIRKFNNDTGEMNEDYKKSKLPFYEEEIPQRIAKVEKDVKEINKHLAEMSDAIPNTSSDFLRRFWNQTIFVTPADFWQLGHDIKEWWHRRYERKRDDHAARLGTTFFSGLPIPYATEFGHEAEARELAAEHKEVEEWQQRFENKDAWDLQELLHHMSEMVDPNKDQLKAVLRILAKKGRINWRDPSLWILLNKLQNEVELSDKDMFLMKNPYILRQRLHKAIGKIYNDYDEFLNLERDNESSYESGKNKYAATFEKMPDQLTAYSKKLLYRHKNGENVDPQEYESLLEFCIKQGKSYAENVMFHIIAGTASGLLAPDRANVLTRNMNTWPAIDFFTSKKLTSRGQFSRIVEKYFPDSFRECEPGKDFMNFYWTQVQNNPAVIQRVRKSAGAGWDHDWIRSIACMGSASSAKQSLAGKSGRQEIQDTAVENSYVGAYQWFAENSKNPQFITRDDLARQFAWSAMSDGILSGVAYNSDKTMARATGSILNSNPREGEVSGKGDWKVHQFRKATREMLDQLDPHLFSLLRNINRAKDQGSELGMDIRTYLMDRYPSLREELGPVRNLDDIFEKMDAITKGILDSKSPEQFNQIIQNIAGAAK